MTAGQKLGITLFAIATLLLITTFLQNFLPESPLLQGWDEWLLKIYISA